MMQQSPSVSINTADFTQFSITLKNWDQSPIKSTSPVCESSNRPNMKTVRVAAAVALLFAFVWIQESSAQADAQMEEMEGPEDVDIPVELKVEEVSVDAMTSPYYRSREKRGIKCKFCCGCCTPGVCGLCCRF
ncbi:hepcidin [Boleophthalmus pectinirostris]|nr:hepcidin [Boleophthalmus pectinirostris]